MVGCAFVEFKKVGDAGAAIKASNAAQFLGRTIAVDWAVPKEVFKQNDKKEQDQIDIHNEEDDMENDDAESTEDDEEEIEESEEEEYENDVDNSDEEEIEESEEEEYEND